MKTGIFLLAMLVVYILGVLVTYRIIFSRLKVGDELFIFFEEGYYETDVIVWIDDESEFVRTQHHGDFNMWDFVKGHVSTKTRV